jgi:RimJ/RimL family protein N-acetyltransferase
MKTPPTLTTARLQLRPFTPADAPRVQELAGQREIADAMISIPHPYVEGMAETWIACHAAAFDAGEEVHFAVQLKHSDEVIGAIELRRIDTNHSLAELSLWVGVDWWGRGYALEATRAVVDYAFGQLGLNRVYAHYMTRNSASRRVLEKAGFQSEGLLRERVRKWGKFEDVVITAILRKDWDPEAGWGETA